MLYLLVNGISTRREFHEVLEHTLESPHGPQNANRPTEVKYQLAEETAEAIKIRLGLGLYLNELKGWFEELEGDFDADVYPPKDWLYGPLDYIVDWIAE